MPTVTIHMPEQSGQTGLTLFLRKTSDGTLVNTGGDALSESPVSSGRFAATVAETWAETLAASVRNAGGLTVRDGWLAAGETIVRDSFPSAGGGGGGAGDASQTTLLAVEDKVDAIAAALGGAPVEPTGATETVMARLTRIETGVSSITPSGVTLVATVRPGGRLVLKAGDDYVASEAYMVDVPIDDPTEAAYLLLTRSQTASIQFGATVDDHSGKIVGTAAKASVYKSGGKTYVPVELSGLTNQSVRSDWKYDIQVTSTTQKKRTVVTGSLEIERDNAL